jgi:hypothetical protein
MGCKKDWDCEITSLASRCNLETSLHGLPRDTGGVFVIGLLGAVVLRLTVDTN